MINKDLGMVTAYAYAVAGGYTGTQAEFEALLGNIASDLAEIENISAEAETLPAGSDATASYSGGVLSFGIPEGDKGDKGDKGNKGDTGATGNGIASIAKTSTSGLVDTYTITFTDGTSTTFDVTNGEVSEAELAETLEAYAKTDGSYSDLTAGNAEQLVSNVRVNDQKPYLFRTSGGSVDIGNREYINGIVGGTVAWNQRVSDTSVFTVESGGNQTHTYAPSTPAKTSHKYLALITQSVALTSATRNRFGYNVGGNNYYQNSDNLNAGTKGWIFAPSAEGNMQMLFWCHTPNATVSFSNAMLFDLTQMFGSTIADYIYSLETATAGAGVAWFKKLFNKPYYAYNAGELMSVSGLVSHDMVGFNAYDSTTGKAKIVGGMQYQITGTYTSLSYSTGETITPNASGIFTPSADGELTVIGGNSTDTCVHLVWDNSRNGEYEPYELHSYPLDSDLTLRGIPKLDANNNLYYDGDIYEPDGTVTRKYGVRAYQSGDESLADAITDGTNTVYKLTTPTTETADAYQTPQIVNDFGTEEFVIDDNTFAVPVGHNTDYPVNLVAKLEMAPNSPEGNGDYIVRQTNGTNEYVPLVIEDVLPTTPSTAGSYKLTVTVADGSDPVLSWEAE